MKVVHAFGWKVYTYHSEDADVDGTILLKQILQQQNFENVNGINLLWPKGLQCLERRTLGSGPKFPLGNQRHCTSVSIQRVADAEKGSHHRYESLLVPS